MTSKIKLITPLKQENNSEIKTEHLQCPASNKKTAEQKQEVRELTTQISGIGHST